MTDYCELHLHDYYSALDGLNSAEEYMARAKELGMTHLAETNHGTLAGHRDFQVAAKAAGIVPILGLEAYISPTDRFDKRAAAKREDGTSVYNHIILLAQSETGIKTLSRLSEKAWIEGYYFKPRMDFEMLSEDNEGIIVLSGCLSGIIAKAIARDDIFTAKQVAKQFKEAFGDRFFIEVQGHNPIDINQGLLAIADEFHIKPVATSDCHYARKEDLWIEEAMLILSTGPKVNREADLAKSKKMDILDRLRYLYPARPISFEEFEIFLRDRQSHVDLFEKQSITRTDIYDNTVDIASTIGEYPFYQGLDLLPVIKDDDAKLRKHAYAGLKRRGLAKSQGHIDRLEDELGIIAAKHNSNYMLIAEDIVVWAKSQNIPCGPGRGSSTGSLVNFVLGVTGIDPIKHGLLFFRFMDPARDDKPDIDFDFGASRRGEVKDYVTRKYKNVASIATFNMFGGKSSLKRASSVFRIPLSEVNRATKDNNAPDGAYYFDYFDVSERGIEFNKKHPEAVNLAKELYGRLSGSGMHASGVVISNEPISNYAPMETAKSPTDKTGPRLPLMAYDMNQAADIGLQKFDFLGLKAMDIIDDTLESVVHRHGTKIDLFDIDFEDKNVYDMLSEGYTQGVFQCEANPYTSLIIEMGGIRTFAELAASNALVRPGAKKTIGAEYIARKNGKLTTYVHPDTQWFTRDTYGEVLYQEQVMLMVTELAGMSMSDANKIRSIIGKKKNPAEFDKYRTEFIEGASKKITKKKAEKLWKDFEAHAGYSFNKSHAVAYSMVSYWTAWLKYHYPLEFMAAVLANEEDKDAITNYLIESKRLKLKVLLPHVNASRATIQIQNEGIRMGLTSVKYIKDKTAAAIIHNRPYASYKDLIEKSAILNSGVNSRAISSLDSIGGVCFEDHPLTGHERDNFYEVLQIPAFEIKDLPPKVKMMFRTLDDYDETSTFAVLGMVRKIVKGTGWARVEVVDETGTAGIFAAQDTPLTSGQMYAILVGKNRVVRYMTIEELSDKIPNEFTNYLYGEIPEMPVGNHRVISNKLYTTKAGKKMSHIILADHTGELLFVMAFPQMYMQSYLHVREGMVVDVVLGETDDGSLFLKEVLK